LKISIDSHRHTSNAHTYTIELDPANYEFKTKSLFQFRDKWFAIHILAIHTYRTR